MSRQRVHKALAGAGVCSRRRAEQLVAAGRVLVNGVAVSDPGSSLDPVRDSLCLDGRLLRPLALEHWMAHKPRGQIRPGYAPGPPGASARFDPAAAPQPGQRRLFAVGRMAAQETGLLLLTNDGRLACRLAGPDCPLDEDYMALVAGRPASYDLRRLRRSTVSGAPTDFRLSTADAGGRGWWVTITAVDRASRGRLRTLMQAVGHPVLELRRTRIGPLELGDLPVAERRRLTTAETSTLCAALGAAPRQ